MTKYQFNSDNNGDTHTLYVDADRMIDLLDSYGIPASYFDKGEYTYANFRATWATIDAKIITCRCGCNLLVKKEGGFRPGHDAKMVGRLLAEVRSGETLRQSAMNMLEGRPNLQAKLARFLDK